MIKSMSMWVISLVALALLLTQVGYRLLESEQAHRVVRSDINTSKQVHNSSDEADAASAADDAGQAGRSQASDSQSALHQRLLLMSEPERNQIFYLIIRDTGAQCLEVKSSQYLIAESGAWHAHCGEAQTYSIVIDAFGSTSVYPIPYGDFAQPMEVLEIQ
ncbi:MAG: hypothetical protein ACREQZ_06675 [Woeseiaceae bacterium]